jgi:hypothetical protein
MKKIKEIKRGFSDGTGSYEVRTLGFMAGERSFILGTYYFGVGMSPTTADKYEELESVIDEIVRNSKKEKNGNVE